MKAYKIIIVLIFSSLFVIPAKGDELTDIVKENIQLQKQVDELQGKLDKIVSEKKLIKENIRLKKDTISNIEEEILNYQKKQNKDSLRILRDEKNNLKAQVKSLDEEINNLNKDNSDTQGKIAEISAQNVDMEGKYQNDVLLKKYEENKKLLQCKYSELINDEKKKKQLKKIKESLLEYKEFPHFNEYKKDVDRTLYYQKGDSLLNAPYNQAAIGKWREEWSEYTDPIKNNQPHHFEELDSMDIKLSRYRGGIVQFKKIIEEIETLQEPFNAKEKIEEYFNSEEIKIFEEKYANNINWINVRYNQLKKRILKDPKNKCQNLKDKILNIEVN